jgi:uncharacterized repeat protein (TIGR02543 family)
MNRNITRKFIPFIMVLVMMISGTPSAFAAGEDSVSTKIVSYSEEQETAAIAAIEDLTAAISDEVPYSGFIVTLKDSEDVDKKAEEDFNASASGDFVAVGAPEDVLEFTDPDNIIAIEPNYEIVALAAPNDPYYASQWDLKSTIAGIGVEAAWDSSLDGEGVNVAIFDTGFQYEVGDFYQTGKVAETINFYDATETPGFTAPDTALSPGAVTDESGHGTSVSSYIGAIKNNNLQMAGIAPNSRFYLYKTLDGTPAKGSMSDVIFALDYLYEEGRELDVINFSFGHTGTPVVAEDTAIQKWISKGTIIVAAASNDGKSAGGTVDPISYPAGYTGVISVAATDSAGNLASFSNENETVDVAAPGQATYHLTKFGGITTGNGTSYASPEVAGVASLVKQYYKEHDLTLDAGVFLDILKDTSTQDHGQKPPVPTHNISFGWGLVNVPNIVETLDEATQKYTITFHPNGGTLAVGEEHAIVTSGASVTTFPVPERDGYTLDGWFTEASGGYPVTSVTNITASAIYYAHWSKESISVQNHSQQEIRDYVRADGAKTTEPVTYQSMPALTAPYDPGALSDATLQSAINMLNQMRYIAGIDYDVTLNDTYTKQSQALTLLNAVNDKLDYAQTKPEGMDDDLFNLGQASIGPSGKRTTLLVSSTLSTTMNNMIVHTWTANSIASTMPAASQRRWILNPQMQQTGLGRTGGTSSKAYFTMYTGDNSRSTSYNAIMWPAQNMPIEYFGNNYLWTIALDNPGRDDTTEVLLTRKSDGREWYFGESDSSDGNFYVEPVDSSRYGKKGAVIFRPTPGSITYNAGDSFDVEITGATYEPINYTVNFFSLMDPPEIISQPQDTVYDVGSTAAGITFDVTGEALSYKWYSNNEKSTSGGALIPGATTATYKPPVTAAGIYYYYATAKNTSGTVTSSAVQVTVNKKNPLVTFPESAVLIYGQTLADAQLIGADTKGLGSFAFDDPTAKPTVAGSGDQYRITFTPDDTVSYLSSSAGISVFVNEFVKPPVNEPAKPPVNEPVKPPVNVPAKITVAKANIAKLTAGKAKLTVTWKKAGKATRYQVHYRLSGKKAWKNVTVNKGKLKLTLNKLKKGKKYQVQVRGYTTVKGKKVYGKWSVAKTVRVNKK